jgi:hypothetical protein
VFSSSIILMGIYLKSRGTPLGKNAFYIAISSLIWSIAGAIYSAPYIEGLQFNSSFFFLSLAAIAGITTTLGAYERAQIQVILTQSDERQLQKSRLWSTLTVLPFAIALVTLVHLALTSSFLNLAIGDTPFMTAIGLIAITGSLIALVNPRFPSKLVYVGSAIAFAIASAALICYSLNISLGVFTLGTGDIATAKAFLIASLALALAKRRGLKAWIIKINLSIGVLFMVTLAFTGYSIGHPAFLSFPTAICLFIVGGVLFWHAWRIHSYKVPPLFIL